MDTVESREAVIPTANPLGLDGIEFIEYATSRPQALGQLLEQMGFRPIARHRSREVLLYRQGDINVIVNAHDAPGAAKGAGTLAEAPVIAAIALRVRNAAAAYRHVLERGAWAVPTHVEVMELNIPAIHGVGSSRIYFVDRYREFSIYDVDFTPIPTVEMHPPALTGLHFFGVVQYVGLDRVEDWTEFYTELFGFTAIPDSERFGVMPRGRVLSSPCGQLMVQLIEPEVGQFDFDHSELLQRIGLGTPDVETTVAALRQRGVGFIESTGVQTSPRGALTETRLGSVVFELVRSMRGAGA
ncbi:MAG TPA: VOC family protein [Methylibium sp.]|uniref:VOC family protein n=1 Tax=Methylibium sp. TaxID=2067992 RepID=UPI002DB6A8F9|nr:VOC family protein [Methylibium sp.]HEU4457604.1 VOC family protein [Methylibium sp.]